MRFTSVKTSSGIERVAKQVALLPDSIEPFIQNQVVFIPEQYKPEAEELQLSFKAYYLDRHVDGVELRVPGETPSRLYVPHICKRGLLKTAVVYVPLDSAAKASEKVAVDMSGMDPAQTSYTAKYCQTAVAEAVTAVADGNYSGIVSKL